MDSLLAAAGEARVQRFVAQSYASTRYARTGGWVKTEDDPLDRNPVAGMAETVVAMTTSTRRLMSSEASTAPLSV